MRVALLSLRDRCPRGLASSLFVASWLVLGGALPACDEDAPACVPGKSEPCTGADGCEGAQLCNEQGTGYLACSCGGGADRDAGGEQDERDAASPADPFSGTTVKPKPEPDAGQAPRADAGERDAATSTPEDAGHDAGPDAVATCDLVAGSGCDGASRCGFVDLGGDDGATQCVAIGAKGLLESCSYGLPGLFTGFDNCQAGLVCSHGRCVEPCALDTGTCPTHFLCRSADVTEAAGGELGVCTPSCDPVAQTRDLDGAEACGSPVPATPSWGCYGNREGFACEPVLHPDTKHGDEAETLSLDACAPGYLLHFKRTSTDATPICVAFCRPAETHSGATSQVGGVAPHTCADRGATGPTVECRYLWPWLSDPAVPIGDDIGVCFDYTHYQYDTDDNMSLDTNWPSCTTLTTGDADMNEVADHVQWGCAPQPLL